MFCYYVQRDKQEIVMIIYLSENSEGLEYRVFKCLRHYYYISANIRDSWGKLFKTDNYKRALVNQEKVLQRYHRLIKRLITQEWTGTEKFIYQEPKLIGSTKLFDVQTKRRQEYMIIVSPKNQ